MTHVSLFTGIGGLDLAAEWAGFETILQVEMDDYANKVLQKHWPTVKRIRDIRDVTADSTSEAVTVISGGFPCQAFSTAARGRNTADDLSHELIRVVGELKPKYAIGENVSEKIIDKVCEQYRAIGYRAAKKRNSANAVGADHQRYRWWAIAYPDNEGQFLGRLNAEMAVMQEIQSNSWTAENLSRVLRIPDGIPNRTHRLRCLGNAVVPKQAYPIFKAIAEVEMLTGGRE